MNRKNTRNFPSSVFRDPYFWSLARATRRFEKKLPNFSKSSPNSLQSKKGQNVYNKAQFESPKHQHQTTFETIIYIKTSHVLKLWSKCNEFSEAKSSPKKFNISLGYFIFFNKSWWASESSPIRKKLLNLVTLSLVRLTKWKISMFA